MVEVNIGLIPATLPPITQVAMVDCRVYRFLLVLLMRMLMRMRGYNTVVTVIEVDISLKIPVTLPLR